jgi:hypothetical protein
VIEVVLVTMLVVMVMLEEVRLSRTVLWEMIG